MLSKYDSRNEAAIPRSQGVYGFFIDAITPEKLGLLGFGRKSFSTSELTLAKSLMVKKVQKLGLLFNSTELGGTLVEKDKGIPGFEFNLTGKDDTFNKLTNLIEELDVNEIEGFVELITSTILFQRPVYCGITKKQTIYQRYQQHKAAFFSDNEKNTFGARFCETGLDWDDLVFMCLPFDRSKSNFVELEKVEKFLMLTSRPALSSR